jgi:hypothetical protein
MQATLDKAKILEIFDFEQEEKTAAMYAELQEICQLLLL